MGKNNIKNLKFNLTFSNNIFNSYQLNCTLTKYTYPGPIPHIYHSNESFELVKLINKFTRDKYHYHILPQKKYHHRHY
jgi:hypothetical protein